MKDKNYFLSKAQENFPELKFTVLTPDINEFIGSSGDSVLIDLREHVVGHFSFAFDRVDVFVDAPVRLNIKFGADTFWEAYIPDNLEFSPYKDRMINSLCNAWSCTPSYFIRKYGLY